MSATTDVASANSSTSFWRIFSRKYTATVREPSTTEATIDELRAQIRQLETTQETRIKALETSMQQVSDAIREHTIRLEKGLGETSSTAKAAFEAFEARLSALESKIDTLQREKNEEETRLAASNELSSTVSRANSKWSLPRALTTRKNSIPASGADSSSMASS